MKKYLKIPVCYLLIICLLTTLQVPIPAKSKVRLNTSKVTLTKGKTFKLKVYGTRKKVKWSSKNRTIATVSKSGKIKAKKNGQTYVYGKIGRKKLKCKVTVKNPVIPKKSWLYGEWSPEAMDFKTTSEKLLFDSPCKWYIRSSKKSGKKYAYYRFYITVKNAKSDACLPNGKYRIDMSKNKYYIHVYHLIGRKYEWWLSFDKKEAFK